MMRKLIGSRGVILVVAVVSVGAAAGGRTDLSLVEAAKDGDAKAIKSLLEKHVDVNAPTVDGTTALHWAVHRNDQATVDQLIRAGANVKVANRFGMVPLSMAAENGNTAIVERLLKAGADPNATLPGGETALMTAARAGDVSVLKVLLVHGANVNAKESTRDQTALMWAAAQGNDDAVKLLVEVGAEVNARSTELKTFHENAYVSGRKNADSPERLPMFTPFLFAVRGGHIKSAEILLDKGANVNDKAPDGTSALHIACINAHWELAGMLVDHGADVNVESPGGTVLHEIADVRAAKTLVKAGGLPPPEGSGTMTAMELVQKVVAHGGNVNARITKPQKVTYGTRPGPQVGLTPLLLTTIPADPEYMRVLLAAGADPKLTTNNHTNFLMMSAGLGLNALLADDQDALTMVKTAIDLGLDVNAQNDDGDTAMHGAAFRNDIPILQYLIDHGAKLDVKNKIGWTPLMEAHWTARGLFNTRPEAEAFLRKAYAAEGLPETVPTREDAIEKLVNSKGGPIISCPSGMTVKAENGGPTVINYPEATATTRRRYAKLKTACSPATGSQFPLGKTIVTCTATDDNNRTDSCTVLMVVQP
jgi:ankyrin repeat protein